MSLDQLETQVTALRNKAEDARAAWNRTVKDINADETLSATGKRDILADGYSHLKQEIVALHKKESDLVTAKRQSLEKSLFGLYRGSDPTQILVYRDARERAARLEDHAGARELYDAAILSDDKTLAAAIVAKSLTSGWHGIVEDYTGRYPTARQDLADLNEIQKYDRMQATMAYMTLPPDFASV